MGKTGAAGGAVAALLVVLLVHYRIMCVFDLLFPKSAIIDRVNE
jgi:hypothetical protein